MLRWEKPPTSNTWSVVKVEGSELLLPGGSPTFKGIRSPNLTDRLDFVSLMLALFCGTASLPHILIRYYTVKDAAAARKSTVVGIGAIGFFYILTLYIGLGAMNFLFAIASVICIVGISFVSRRLHTFWPAGFTVAGWFVLFMIWSYLVNVASLVFKGALYLYAAEGVVVEPYDQQLLDSAWRYKR